MEKKAPHKKLGHHKSRFVLFGVIGLILLVTLVWVTSDNVISPKTSPSYQSIEEGEAHDNYEEPAEGEYKETIIRIKDGKFVPDKLEVPPGTLILFENEEKAPHVVVSDTTGKEDEITFDTGELPYEERVPTVEYGIAGTYHYHDKLNPQLKGVIVVKE